MQRYFVDIKNDEALFNKEDEHHLVNVNRTKIGEQIEVIFSNTLYLAQVSSLSPLKVDIVSKLDQTSNSIDLTLIYALSKGDKNELVIQKATEIGVKRIILLDTNRCVVRLDQKDFMKKLDRYKKIAKQASEQSHRFDVPLVEGLYKIKDLPNLGLKGNMYVAYEAFSGVTTDFFSSLINANKDDSFSLLVGSEGGLEDSEVKELNKIGFKNVSLGKRILRTETAAIYGLSVISFLLER